MTTVYLIRHAEAEGNVCRRCHGQYDSLLTERAGAQLACLAKRFAEVPLDAIYASDLYRARHTAKAIADTKGMKVRVRQVLREIDMGDWEDLLGQSLHDNIRSALRFGRPARGSVVFPMGRR